MYFTNLSSAGEHPELPAAIRRAIAYIRATDFKALAPGEYPIEGDKLFAKVFDVTTKPVEDSLPEFHKNYVDVQFWPEGEELMGYAPNTGVNRVVRADESQDLYFADRAAGEVFIPAGAGDVMALFPSDLHRPAIQKDGPITFRKVVVKVSVELL